MTPKRPRDPNQLAKAIVDIATGNIGGTVPPDSPMADLGRAGGLKGGKARAASMTPERRAEIAKRAAEARWKKPGDQQ
jgi:hypothetical protein